MIQIQKKIYNLLKLADVKIYDDYIIVPNNFQSKSVLDDLGISGEEILYNSTLNIQKDSLPCVIYNDFSEYLNIEEVNNKNVLILNFEDSAFSFCDLKTYIGFEEVTDNYFFSNIISYCEFLDCIKLQDKDSEDPFHFVDHFDGTIRKMIFTSLSDNGRIVIKYFKNIKHFNSDVDLSINVENFKKCFIEDNYQLPKFLKNSLIDYSSRFDEKSRIYMLFENLDQVVDKAKINFEIYLNGLSIDKIRKEYDDYKSKYFKEISEVLSNLTTKIVGFPILIATTLFAIEKIKDSTIFLILLIVVTIITNIYLVFLLFINFKDLKYIEVIAESDYETLISNNFFKNNIKEIDAFLNIKRRITSRINYLKKVCESYYWVLGISNLITISLMLSYLKINNDILFVVVLIGLFILSICRNNILNNIDKITN